LSSNDSELLRFPFVGFSNLIINNATSLNLRVFLNLSAAVIHAMCDGRFKAVSKTHSPLEEERSRAVRKRRESASETARRVSRGISSERETDGQEYRHSNKEGK